MKTFEMMGREGNKLWEILRDLRFDLSIRGMSLLQQIPESRIFTYLHGIYFFFQLILDDVK